MHFRENPYSICCLWWLFPLNKRFVISDAQKPFESRQDFVQFRSRNRNKQCPTQAFKCIYSVLKRHAVSPYYSPIEDLCRSIKRSHISLESRSVLYKDNCDFIDRLIEINGFIFRGLKMEEKTRFSNSNVNLSSDRTTISFDAHDFDLHRRSERVHSLGNWSNKTDSQAFMRSRPSSFIQRSRWYSSETIISLSLGLCIFGIRHIQFECILFFVSANRFESDF